MSCGESITLLSANCQGCQTNEKKYDVLNYLKMQNYDVVCLQDTHWTAKNSAEIRKLWGGECIIHGNKTNARGVAILFSNKIEYTIHNTNTDTDGNMLVLDLKISDYEVKLINVYCPNRDSPLFFKNLNHIIETNTQDYVLLCGDLNLVLDSTKDSSNYVNINNPQSRSLFKEMLMEHNLTDVFRYLHQDKIRYTWRRKNPIRQARLDYWITSSVFTDVVNSCEILAGYRSDHSQVKLKISINKFVKGRGTWKFNTSLLKKPEYIEKINNVILNEVLQYAIPIYSPTYLKNPENYKHISLKIDEDLFLETLLLRIRGETMKFSSTMKSEACLLENTLIEEINKLETQNLNSIAVNILENKKSELEELRKEKMKGHVIRSRAQYLSDGEKATKYFCSLENKNYIEKTVKKLVLNNNQCITDQHKILKEMQTFYTKLFQNCDSDLSDIELDELLEDYDVNKLNECDSQALTGKLTEKEITFTLRNMKNNKSPGIDGFSAEFFKMFWSKMKYFVLRSINRCYDKGILSISLRRCMVTCLPKGDKPRENLKNWRPISLLSVVYKIASATIANRIKPVLDKIIAKTQTGFISGRYIGESTRLVYDIMQVTEQKNINGLLMLIDFEKAFDSISWKFMYKVFEFFNFPADIVNWIKLFNKNMESTIIQCGILSDFFTLQRGCKQGDPLACYEFIICGEILSILIKNNTLIKGIIIGDFEYKLTQFADDTSLLMDGTQGSLLAALNTLEIYGTLSGLKMNTEKTKVIWLGRKKFSRDKLECGVPLQWNCTEFCLLGLEYSVNLSKMESLNFNKALNKSRNVLNNWRKRYLTPVGKITVIKTFILSVFNHLFISLPNPSETIIKDLKKIIFSFIWDKKPEKISREQLNQSYSSGGLKMIDIDKFIAAQKSTWIRKIVTGGEAMWLTLLYNDIPNLQHGISCFGSHWSHSLTKKITNKFWIDVFDSWCLILSSLPNGKYYNPCLSPLWYNPLISNELLYFKHWYNNGIIFVGDLLDNNGNIKSMENLSQSYHLANLNFLEYLRIRYHVNMFLSKTTHVVDLAAMQIIGPIIPDSMRIIVKNKKGSKIFYNTLKNETYQVKSKAKWHEELNIHINDQAWKHIYYCCFYTIPNPSIMWFQYRILNRILGVNKLRNQIDNKISYLCRMCNFDVESISHMFVNCTKTKTLWKDIKDHIRHKLRININLDPLTIILGYLLTDTNQKPMNTILLTVKKYIFSCAYKGRNLSFTAAMNNLRFVYNDLKFIAAMNNKELEFSKSWGRWEPLFLGN